MTLPRRTMRLALCTSCLAAMFLLLTGCAGNAPTSWQPRHPAIPPLIALIRSAGPQFTGHADALQGLWERGRLVVSDSTPGHNDAWTIWRGRTYVIVRREFLVSSRVRAEDQAALLLIEACHAVTHQGAACHDAELEREFYKALREMEDGNGLANTRFPRTHSIGYRHGDFRK